MEQDSYVRTVSVSYTATKKISPIVIWKLYLTVVVRVNEILEHVHNGVSDPKTCLLLVE